MAQYDAGLDRITGQDLLQNMGGRDVLNFLLSLRRATSLYHSLQELSKLFAGVPQSRGLPDDKPVPSPYTILELEAADLFGAADMARLPFEYHQLARLVVALPARYTPLDGASLTVADVSRFARSLLAVLSVTHKKAAMCFSRGQASSITTGSVATGGQILDPYYLTRASEAGRGFAGLVRTDVRQGLWLVRGTAAGAGRPALSSALSTAIASYLGPGAAPPAAMLPRIKRLGGRGHDDEDWAIVTALAAELA